MSDPSDYREDIGLCQVINPAAVPPLVDSFRRVEEFDRQSVSNAMRHLADACGGLSEDMHRSLRRFILRSWQDKTGGIRYGQPWQAIAKPPYRKELF